MSTVPAPLDLWNEFSQEKAQKNKSSVMLLPGEMGMFLKLPNAAGNDVLTSASGRGLNHNSKGTNQARRALFQGLPLLLFHVALALDLQPFMGSHQLCPAPNPHQLGIKYLDFSLAEFMNFIQMKRQG